jgi:hypothetical protein
MRILLLFLCVLVGFQANAQRTCSAHDHHEELMAKDPEYAKRHAEIEAFTEQFIRSGGQGQLSRGGEIIIPVVFHIIYNTAAQNISEQRILEQMQTFNDDFNATNADTSLIPGPFKPLKGAFNVKFVLANRDPQGNPTTGIVRRQTTRTSFSASSVTSPTAQPMKFTAQGGSDAWDTRSYFNVWVCNLSGGVLGYATFPASAGTLYDGIVLGSAYTGSTGASAPFNKGRTGTHEVGHYFNLRHIWGDATACTASDFVDDTPPQRTSTGGCPSWPRTDACTGTSPGIMFMNYMDYTNDACMYMFSQGQVGRMEAALNGPRASLLTSTGFVSELENDLEAAQIVSPPVAQCATTFAPQVSFTNAGTEPVTTFTATYVISGAAPVSKVWTGTLAPDATAAVEFDEITISEGSYLFTSYSTGTNGVADEDTSNDTIQRIFSVATADATISGDVNLCQGESTTLSAATCGDLDFKLASFLNTDYLVLEFDTTGVPYEENPIEVQISIDSSRANTLSILNFGDWGSPLPAFLTFSPDPSNPTITVQETVNGFAQAGVNLLWTGSGTYDICTKSFTVVYAFKNPSTGAILVPAVKFFINEDALQPLNFLWSNGDTTPSITVTPAETTEYTLTVTTASGCTASSSTFVTVTPLVTPTFNTVGPICSGATAPVLVTTSTNGVAGTWSPAVVSNTTSGTYNFTPTAGQCAVEASLTVTVNPSVTPTFDAIAPFCAGEEAPALPTTSNNGVSGTWAPTTISNTASGSYSFTAGDEGCFTPATLNVTVKPIPAAPTAGSNSPVVEGSAINLSAGTVAGATYTWTGPNGFSSSAQNPSIPSATPANAGEYSVFVTVDGCEGEAATVTVVVNTGTSVKESVLYGMLIAPNPFRYSTTLSFDLLEQKRVVISVTDISGRELEKQIVNAGSGRNVLEVGRNLVSGTYLLSVDTGSEIKTLKMVVVK